VWTSAWCCDLHGEIAPLAPARLPSRDGLQLLASHTTVPVWLPWPLPAGWLVSGFTGAGDERTGARASAVALSGPNPLGGPADLLIVAEEPGVGLGAGLAGLPGPDPGDGFARRAPHATVKVANHEAPLWVVESAGSLIQATDSDHNLPSGLGSRHAAAAAISVAAECISLVVSSSTGQVTLFRRGVMLPLTEKRR